MDLTTCSFTFFFIGFPIIKGRRKQSGEPDLYLAKQNNLTNLCQRLYLHF